MDALTDNLVRVRPDVDGATVRVDTEDGAGNGRTLFGHFSVFDAWYEVNSVWEGNFLERTVSGAFDDTLTRRRGQIKAQYEHGHDPYVGAAPLGAFTDLREDDVGGYYAIDLIDTDYNRDRIIPQARAGLLGASFRFRVTDEHWEDNPKRSEHNPKGIPERSILSTEVYELGPVVFGASPAASAAMRSGTDQFIDRLLNDPIFLARYAERVGSSKVEDFLTSLPEISPVPGADPQVAPVGAPAAGPQATEGSCRSLSLAVAQLTTLRKVPS